MTRLRVLRAQHATILAAGLRDRGFAVCDLGLPSSTLSGLREEALGLHTSRDEPEFFSAVGKNQHRGDLIGWLGARGAAARKLRHLPLALDILLSELPAVLRDDGIAAPSRRVLPPAAAMLSLYQDGAAYAAHRDGVRASHRGARGFAAAVARALWTRGGAGALVEAANLGSQVAQREYTAILYLNAEDWCARRDGGALRIFGGCDEDDDAGGSATDVEDVAPVGGRLVVFDSRAILHEVLPATRVRLAMTAWLLNEEAVLGERTAASLITD